MSYFDQISPATPHQVLVDLTEFSKSWQAWRRELEEQIVKTEGLLNAELESANKAGEESLMAAINAAAQKALAQGEDPLSFAAFLSDDFLGAQSIGKQLLELRKRVYDGPKWTLQWAQIDTAAFARALKNVEIIQRRHPDWNIEQVSVVAFLAAHHQAQAGEPSPGEIYDTLADRSEFVDVWRYITLRFREEFPEIFASDAATLKNVFCGRALSLEQAGTPQN